VPVARAAPELTAIKTAAAHLSAESGSEASYGGTLPRHPSS
jgi:hypothetical protein